MAIVNACRKCPTGLSSPGVSSLHRLGIIGSLSTSILWLVALGLFAWPHMTRRPSHARLAAHAWSARATFLASCCRCNISVKQGANHARPRGCVCSSAWLNRPLGHATGEWQSFRWGWSYDGHPPRNLHPGARGGVHETGGCFVHQTLVAEHNKWDTTVLVLLKNDALADELAPLPSSSLVVPCASGC